MTSWFAALTSCCRGGHHHGQRHYADPNTSSIEKENNVVDENEQIVIEQQPLRRQDDQANENQLEKAKEIEKLNEKRKKNHSTFLCCSTEPLREEQVDLCPRSWWDVCWMNESPLDPSQNQQVRPLSGICWRLAFISCCLPACYTCYLTRSVRRRKRKVVHPDYTFDSCSSESENGISKPFEDDLNQTMSRTVSNSKCRYRTKPAFVNEAEQPDVKSDCSKDLQNVIQVNVIILQSTTSRLLQRHLYGTDQTDGGVNLRPSSYQSVTLRKKAVSYQHLKSQQDFSAGLKAVEEGNEENSSNVPEISLTRASSTVEAPSIVKRPSVMRRWSQLGSFGSTVARFSKGLKKTDEEEDGAEVNLDVGCESVPLRKEIRDSSARRQTFRKPSKSSHSSVYYSFDGGAVTDIPEETNEQSVEMKSLDQRIEFVKDLGYLLSFSVFDEASVTEWKGRDLKLANQIPNIDILIIAVKRGNVSELESIMNMKTGMMNYISKFWRGYYPLLLVEVQSKDSSIEDATEFTNKLQKMCNFFGDVHHIKVFEDSLDDQLEWVDECLARLFIHSRIYQCSRFFGANIISRIEKCPGGCGLRKRRNKTKLSRQRAKINNRFKSLYRKPREPS